MHRNIFSVAAAFTALAVLTALFTSQSPARADYTYATVYTYGGVSAPDGSYLSIYVSGNYWMGSHRGTIAITGAAGRIDAPIRFLSFASAYSCTAVGDLNFTANGVTEPATVTVQMSKVGRGIISWNVVSKATGASLWSFAPTAMTTGSTLITVR
jgi:hypothetical protein